MNPIPRAAKALAFTMLISANGFASGAKALSGADHHMHLRSESSSQAWAALCEAMPEACGALPSAPPPTSADELITMLDEAGLHGGAVLSIAYFFGFPALADTRFNDAELVREENRYIAEQVGSHPRRLSGFFSVNPLADYAPDEVRYWSGRSELAGLKLHMANSGVDLANAEHLERLAELFRVLDERGKAAVIHLRSRNPEYGHADAKAFIDAVLVPAPNVPVQIAHMGGWGGYDQGTDSALGAFLEAIDDGRLDRERVYFGLAAVVLPNTSDEQLELLGSRIVEIGPDRVLFGTDWDALETPANALRDFADRKIVDEEAREIIVNNQAPWIP